jgi:NTP pyrophosphatase (non-canonical NTP hydrolase)
MEIKELVEKAHKNAERHGFWDDYYNITQDMISAAHYDELVNNAIGNRLMLIVSELGEAQEGLRHNDEANFREELADVAIRLGDLCGGLGIDLEAEIEKKMAINEKRPYKHDKAF